MFNVERLKKESGFSKETLKKIEDEVRKEFPDDEMMFKLHLLRVLSALKEGTISLDDVVSESKRAAEA